MASSRYIWIMRCAELQIQNLKRVWWLSSHSEDRSMTNMLWMHTALNIKLTLRCAYRAWRLQSVQPWWIWDCFWFTTFSERLLNLPIYMLGQGWGKGSILIYFTRSEKSLIEMTGGPDPRCTNMIQSANVPFVEASVFIFINPGCIMLNVSRLLLPFSLWCGYELRMFWSHHWPARVKNTSHNVLLECPSTEFHFSSMT